MTGSSPRDLRTLPKAHLHLHFTGSLRPATMRELAAHHDVRLPDALRGGEPPELTATDDRGWFRFQRLYDTARSVVRTEDDIRRLLLEAAEDDRAEGSGWLEIQVDPTTYATRIGGLTPTTELILAAAREAAAATGVGIGVVIAANRTRHPLDARTLARLAARYAGEGVVGFGLSNDERRGSAEDFAPAFRIAARAGLASVPHGGELAGAQSVASCLDLLGADRIGHGVRAVEQPGLVRRLADAQTTLEVCPTSNVRLGVYAEPCGRAAADVAGGGCADRARCRRPAAVRLAPGRPVRRGAQRPRDDRRRAGRAGQGLGPRLPGARRRPGTSLLSGIDAWLAAPG